MLKAIALSQGLDSFSAHTAYIYRSEAGMHGKNEIPIDLKGILNRKVPDPPLYADDMLYIPNSAGRRNTAKIVELTLGCRTWHLPASCSSRRISLFVPQPD